MQVINLPTTNNTVYLGLTEKWSGKIIFDNGYHRIDMDVFMIEHLANGTDVTITRNIYYHHDDPLKNLVTEMRFLSGNVIAFDRPTGIASTITLIPDNDSYLGCVLQYSRLSPILWFRWVDFDKFLGCTGRNGIWDAVVTKSKSFVASDFDGWRIIAKIPKQKTAGTLMMTTPIGCATISIASSQSGLKNNKPVGMNGFTGVIINPALQLYANNTYGSAISSFRVIQSPYYEGTVLLTCYIYSSANGGLQEGDIIDITWQGLGAVEPYFSSLNASSTPYTVQTSYEVTVSGWTPNSPRILMLDNTKNTPT